MIKNIRDALIYYAENNNNGIKFLTIEEESHLSYRDLLRCAQVLLYRLRKQGIRKGNELIFQISKPSEFIISFWASILGGFIPVPIPVDAKDTLESKVKFMLIYNTLKCPYIITNKETEQRLNSAYKTFLYEEKEVVLDLKTIVVDFEEIQQEQYIKDDNYCEVTDQDIAMIQFSSGSTGIPKGIALTHDNIYTDLMAGCKHYNVTESDRFLSWLPLTHDFGLMVMHLVPIIKGVNQCIMDPKIFLRNPNSWIQELSSYKATITGAPNFAYKTCAEYFKYMKEPHKLDLTSLRLMMSGGEPVSNKVSRAFMELLGEFKLRNNVIQPVYGLAEMTVAVSGGILGEPIKYLALDRNFLGVGEPIRIDKEGYEVTSVGRLLECNDVQITDNCGQALGEGYIGVIHAKGRNIMKEYYNNTKATEEILQNGWLNTGDIGFIYEEYLFITGRQKDIIFINGQNFYAHDIERVISSTSEFANRVFAAIGSFDYETGKEKIVLVSEFDIQDKLTFEEQSKKLVAIVSKNFGIQVNQILDIKDIPKTSSGKIQRVQLQKDLEQNTLVPQHIYNNTRSGRKQEEIKRVDSSKNIEQILIEEVEELTNIQLTSTQLEISFTELGLSSLELEQLFCRVEERFEVTLDIVAMWNYPTVKKLSKYLNEKLQVQESNQVEKQESLEANQSPIAIVGMGCRFPGEANTIEAYWQNLIEKKDCICEMPKERELLLGKASIGKAGYIRDIDKFDAQFFSISPNEANKMDPQQRLLLQVAYDALVDANIPIDKVRNTDTGVFIGISNQDYATLASKNEEVDLYMTTGNAHAIAANRVSYYFGLNGPSMAIDTACSSSLVAVHNACTSLLNNECSMALVGGVNVILLDEVTVAFKKAQMLAEDYRCKTFDVEANGYVRSEGCGMVVLKRLDQAIKDGDEVIALIKGSAINQDGKSNGLTAPNGIAQNKVIHKALQNAKLKPSEVDYIEAHGTGTRLGDPIELNTLGAMLIEGRTKQNPCFIGSVKTNIGHLESAAGIASFIKTAMILKHNYIPQILHFSKLNPYIKVDTDKVKIADEQALLLRNKEIKYAGISSFGFGGTNAHIILEKYVPDELHKVEKVNIPVHKFNNESYWFTKREENLEYEGLSMRDNEKLIALVQEQVELLKVQNNTLSCLLEENQRGQGKVELNELKKEVAAHSNTMPMSVETRQLIDIGEFSDELLKIVSELTAYPKERLSLDHQLISDLGFDSIMIISLANKVIALYPVLKESMSQMTATIYQRNPKLEEIIELIKESLAKHYVVIDENYERFEGREDVSVPASQYIFTEFEEYQIHKKRMEEAKGYNPYYKVNTGIARDIIHIDGQPMINFATYNYVGMNGNMVVLEDTIKAINQYGTSVSGSRLLSGEIPLHRELEQKIAQFLGTEDSIVYIGGHSTNVNTISHMVGEGDLILHDSLIHNSVIQGCLLSGATRRPFPHNDMAALKEILLIVRNQYRRVLLIVEGVYSMDGDMCPLPELIQIKKKYKALLMVDEAHSLGTIGDCGRGIASYFKVNPHDVDLWMGTLSKSLASCGGYIAGKSELVDYLKYTSPGFIFSVGITPSNTAAALSALEQLEKNPSIIGKLSENSSLFLQIAKEAGFDTGLSQETPVIPIILKDSNKCLKLSKRLLERNINVMPIVYPAVAENEARLRFFLSVLHTPEQIKYTVQTLKEEYLKLE